MRRKRFTRRRRAGTRASTRPQRWEVANFFDVIPQIVDPSIALGTTVMVELLKSIDHIGDGATGQGQALSAMSRYIEIGGIVFDIEVSFEGVYRDETVGPEYFYVTEFLCTEQLDAGGNPVNVPDYFQTQKPIQLANVGSLLNEEPDFPLRTHWRRSYSNLFPTVAPTPYNGTFAVHTRQTKSLRLKRRLDDDQGLYLGATIGFPGIAQENFSLFVAGTLYYRIRF